MNYFERTIARLTSFGAPGLTMPTAQNAGTWIDRIENELSPENLTCDGELPYAQVQAKKRELSAALAHCQALLGITLPSPQQTRTILTDAFREAYRVSVQHAKRTRTHERIQALTTALHQGFVVGVRVILSNGHRGRIVKINRTRVKVQTDDQRMWSVPPRCMELEKAVR